MLRLKKKIEVGNEVWKNIKKHGIEIVEKFFYFVLFQLIRTCHLYQIRHLVSS